MTWKFYLIDEGEWIAVQLQNIATAGDHLDMFFINQVDYIDDVPHQGAVPNGTTGCP